MAAGIDVYAPLNLPRDFRIALDDIVAESQVPHAEAYEVEPTREPNILDFADYQHIVRYRQRPFAPFGRFAADFNLKERIAAHINELEKPDQEAIELTWDTVRWRRFVSFATFVATAMLLLHPFLKPPRISLPIFMSSVITPFEWMNAVGQVFSAFGMVLQPLTVVLLELMSSFLPGVTKSWIDYYRIAPWHLVWWGTIVATLLAWGSLIDRRIQDRALAAWNVRWRAIRSNWIRQSTTLRMLFGITLAVVAGGYFLLWSAALITLVWFLWFGLTYTIYISGSTDPMQFTITTPEDRASAVSYFSIHLKILIPGVITLGVLCGLLIRWIVSNWSLRHQAMAEGREFPGFALWITRRIAHSRILVWFSKLVRTVIPAAFPLALVLGGVVALNTISFSVISAGGWVCLPEGGSSMALGEKREFRLRAKYGCQSTQILIDAGATYRIDIENREGFNLRELEGERLVEDEKMPGIWEQWEPHWPTKLAVFFRRFPFVPWFQPIAQVGYKETEQFVLDQSRIAIDKLRVYRLSLETAEEIIVEKRIPRPSNEITSTLPDNPELFVFVNDVVIGIPKLWDLFYRENGGTGTVTVTKMVDGPTPTTDVVIRFVPSR